mmetsp:Transcript_6237/g.10824  ORF Transcript_6237/g.10824 Transcript_6237/m.10824 type:complete len:82 (-) Transcript_6237:478-723(-)
MSCALLSYALTEIGTFELPAGKKKIETKVVSLKSYVGRTWLKQKDACGCKSMMNAKAAGASSKSNAIATQNFRLRFLLSLG